MGVLSILTNPWGALGGVVASAAVGALAWNFCPIVGPHAVQAKLNTSLGAASARMLADAAQMKADAAAIRDRDARLKANGQTETNDAEQTADFWQGQCATAYKAGAARAAIPASPSPAPAGPGLGLGVGTPVGVRGDLRDLWTSGQFPGSADHPAVGGNGQGSGGTGAAPRP